jgi:hypothetical protein
MSQTPLPVITWQPAKDQFINFPFFEATQTMLRLFHPRLRTTNK